MSVTKKKTLAKVRTFAQDFSEHQDPAGTVAPSAAPLSNKVPAVEKKNPSVTISKTPKPTKKKDEAKSVITHIVAEEKKETKKPHSDKSAAQNMPAFHELQKAADAITKTEHHASTPRAIKAPKIKVQKTPKKTKKRVNTGAPATVITATKKSKGRASERSLFEDLSAWFKKLFTPSKKKTPTYMVQDTVRRKGVIEKATTKSGTIFTADNQTLREDILRRRKQQEHEIDVTWTPNTDTGYNLLEAPHDEPKPAVAITFKKQALPEPVITEPDTRWENVPVEEPEPVIEKPIPEPIIQTPAPDLPPVPPTLPKGPAPVPVSIPVQTPVTEEQSQPVPVRHKVEPFKALRSLLSGTTEGLNTNAIALGAVSAIATVFIFVTIVRALFGLIATESTTLIIETVDPIIPGLQTLVVALPETNTNTLQQNLTNSGSLVQNSEQEIQFTNELREPLTPQEIVSLLDFGINPNLNQSILDLHFVVIDTVQNAIVFTVTDSITALGGMLAWEKNMLEDLRTPLNTISTPEASSRFVDETYGDIDMRVLTDGVDEVLVYGFINENTILITKTTETFIRLAD